MWTRRESLTRAAAAGPAWRAAAMFADISPRNRPYADDVAATSLPSNWRVGDKTGSGSHNATNDVAIAWPPNRAPVIIAVHTFGATADGGGRNAAIADAARLVTNT
jgi:beta-lactamase class A